MSTLDTSKSPLGGFTWELQHCLSHGLSFQVLSTSIYTLFIHASLWVRTIDLSAYASAITLIQWEILWMHIITDDVNQCKCLCCLDIHIHKVIKSCIGMPSHHNSIPSWPTFQQFHLVADRRATRRAQRNSGFAFRRRASQGVSKGICSRFLIPLREQTYTAKWERKLIFPWNMSVPGRVDICFPSPACQNMTSYKSISQTDWWWQKS